MIVSFLRTFVQHPRRLFLRRALFQIHLWAGVLLSIYVVVIALTGSILVFRTELERATLPQQLGPYSPLHVASIATVLDHFRTAYPDAELVTLQMPSDVSPAFKVDARQGNHAFSAAADASTGAVFPQQKGWLTWVYDLHVYLLAGHQYGMQINAVGSAVLLVLCLTGAVIWWPGIKVWTRGLRVALGRNWRRVNFDLHSAIGIWTLALVFWWALSGVYFGFYKQVSAAVGWVSPLRGMVSPALPSETGQGQASLEQVLASIHQASPTGRLFSISDPALSGKIIYALVDLRAAGDFSHRDIITVSTSDARVLTIWHYGSNQTAGDWIIWAMHPLHFGTLWGIWIKVLWAGAGLSLAILSVTGLLMYWNRWLRHQLYPTVERAKYDLND